MSDKFPHLACVWGEPYNWDSLNVQLQVPDEPGFYAFTDHSDPLQASVPGKQVLYIGIATQSLRERIKKYKAGDNTNRGLMNMHAGGFFMLLSRADSAHYDGKTLTHSVQRTPVNVTIKATASKPAQHSVLTPNSIFLRWSVDYRAAIESLLINQLNPKYNIMLVKE